MKALLLVLMVFLGGAGGEPLQALESDVDVEVESEEEMAAVKKVYKSPKYDEKRDYSKNEYEEEVLEEKEAHLKKVYEGLLADLEVMEGERAAITRAAWEEAQKTWEKFMVGEAYARAAAFSTGGSIYSTYFILECVDLVIARTFSLEAVKKSLPMNSAIISGKVVTKNELAKAREKLQKVNAEVKQGERKLLKVFNNKNDQIHMGAREDILKVPKHWNVFQEAEGKARAMVVTGGATEGNALELARLEAMTKLAERRIKVLKQFHERAVWFN